MRATVEAVIVAAGFGSRLQPMRPGGEIIKPLTCVGGVPLLKRVLDKCGEAGIEKVHIVVGHMADELTARIKEWEVKPAVEFIYNPRYELSNGVSLHCGALRCSGPFVLLMSDHLFQLQNLTGLLERGLQGDSAVLAVDSKIQQVFDLDDATLVLRDGDRILKIGKQLTDYNSVDTGMFLMSGDVATILTALIEEKGDASISDVMTRFIEEDRMGAFDVGDGVWQDVDDPDMLVQAERLVGEGVFDK